MRLQIGCIDHDCLRIGALSGQADHDPGEDPVIAPPLPAIVDGLRWSTFPVRAFSRTGGVRALTIAPPQAIAVDEDNAAQNPQIVYAWAAMALGKERTKAGHLRLGQPEQVAHQSGLLAAA